MVVKNNLPCRAKLKIEVARSGTRTNRLLRDNIGFFFFIAYPISFAFEGKKARKKKREKEQSEKKSGSV